MSYTKVDEDARCERCGSLPHFHFRDMECYLFTYTAHDDELGETITKRLCRRCDWEIMNNWASLDEDVGEMALRRREEDYTADPINNPPPL